MTDSITAVGAIGATSATDRALLEALAQLAASSATSIASQPMQTSHAHAHREATSSNSQSAQETNLQTQAEDTNALRSLPSALPAAAGLRMMAKDAPYSSNTANGSMGTAETAANTIAAATIASNPKHNTETLLPPAVVSQLHVTSEQAFRRLDGSPTRKERLHRRWLNRKLADDERNQDEDLTQHQQHETSDDAKHEARDQQPLSQRAKVVAEQSEPLFLRIVAKLEESKCEASRLALLEIARGRRVLVAFPAEDDHSLQSVAQAYLIWRKDDKGLTARIHARLYWANTKRVARLIGLRVRKDCSETGQRILKPDSASAINPEGAAILSLQSLAQVLWTEAALVISEAVRLWSLVGEQWNICVVIATAPLAHYSESQ